jgi:hypothetical protein
MTWRAGARQGRWSQMLYRLPDAAVLLLGHESEAQRFVHPIV